MVVAVIDDLRDINAYWTCILGVFADGFSIAAGDTGMPSSTWEAAVACESVESSEQVDWGNMDSYGGMNGIIDNNIKKRFFTQHCVKETDQEVESNS